MKFSNLFTEECVEWEEPYSVEYSVLRAALPVDYQHVNYCRRLVTSDLSIKADSYIIIMLNARNQSYELIRMCCANFGKSEDPMEDKIDVLLTVLQNFSGKLLQV